MKRQADNHGYLMIDHRASPGIDAETALKFRMPFVPGGTMGEFKTLKCAHCGGSCVMNPARTRERGHCRKCDAYTCDLCAALGDCRPIAALADAVAGSDKPLAANSPLILRS